MLRQTKFACPPRVTNADGQERSVGVEIEFGSVGAEAAAGLIKALLGGTVVKHNPNAFDVKGTALGDFFVKLDTRFAGYAESQDGFLGEVTSELASFLGAAAGLIVPFEIAAPPVKIHQLPEIDELICKLRGVGAEGTEASVLFAFGLQLNPESPGLDARTITAILKAFALASPWLWRAINPDQTRRLLNFAKPYPKEYVQRIVSEDYWPDIGTLIDDYIALNPTRNRDLDLLPLFAFLDEDRVRSRLPEEKINTRPTFHYRLPDMSLEDKDWGLATEWNRWVAVERLAADQQRLTSLSQAFLDHSGSRDAWGAQLEGLNVE